MTVNRNELAAKIDALVLHMQQVATEIDYYGGMAEWAAHGAELMNASLYAETWADGIRKEVGTEIGLTKAEEIIYCYAPYEEGPYYEYEWDAACYLDEYEEGQPVTIWRGIKTKKYHHDFIEFDADNIIESMREMAYEECGEVADDYMPPLHPEQAKSLESHMKKSCAEWFDKNIPQPNFFLAEKIEAMEVHKS